MLHSHTLGHGPHLVLIHGWGMNSTIWDDTATALAAAFQVTCIDLPGHGHSPWTGNALNLEAWTRACLDIAPPTAHWIGWSLGGTLALNAALLAPQRIRALTMITAPPSFLCQDHWPHGLKPAVLVKFRETLKTKFTDTLGDFLTLQVHGSQHATAVLRILRQRLAAQPTPHPQALDIGLALLRDTDLTPQLPNLPIPSLWLYGQRDTLVPWRSSITLHQLLPTAHLAIIPGAAHAPFLSHPTETWELLHQFATTNAT